VGRAGSPGKAPSRHRRRRTCSLRRLRHEEGRRFFQDLLLHPQRRVLPPQPDQLAALGLAHLIRALLTAASPVSVDPVAERALVDPKVTRDLSDALTGLPDHRHRGLPELLRVLRWTPHRALLP